jgi:hypothetical protein
MNENQQIRFAFQSVAIAIEEMKKQKKTKLFYSQVFDADILPRPGILRKHLLEVVMLLQDVYRGQLTVSRTPGGLVVHVI